MPCKGDARERRETSQPVVPGWARPLPTLDAASPLRSAGRARGGSRGALKLQDSSGHAEAVAPNGCSGGHWAGYRQCPMGLGMGLHPTASPDVTPVLLAQPPWEPGHGAGPAACSAGVGDEGLPPPALPTLAS